MRFRAAAVMMMLAASLLAHAQENERAAWRLKVDEARERAAALRAQSRLQLQRRPEDQSVVPEHILQARRNSAAVLGDTTLRRGDIVSTLEGLSVFMGREGIEPVPTDFIPYRGLLRQK